MLLASVSAFLQGQQNYSNQVQLQGNSSLIAANSGRLCILASSKLPQYMRSSD